MVSLPVGETRTGKAKSPSFREHDVTHLCVVLYLHAAHEYNLISALWNGNKEKEAISYQKCVSKCLNNRIGTFSSDYGLLWTMVMLDYRG